jgi:hypothetical protein
MKGILLSPHTLFPHMPFVNFEKEKNCSNSQRNSSPPLQIRNG